MYSNTILKLDLIIIIIQKYCEKYLKHDKNIDIKKSKTIKFVLEKINDIKKTKDFKTLKSIFTIEKKYKIKDIKDWLSILCVNKTELFSKYFKLEVEIDLTKSYRTYVNLLSKLEVNKTKCDLKTSTKKISIKKISILFNLLFYDVIVGGVLPKIYKKTKKNDFSTFFDLLEKEKLKKKKFKKEKEKKKKIRKSLLDDYEYDKIESSNRWRDLTLEHIINPNMELKNGPGSVKKFRDNEQIIEVFFPSSKDKRNKTFRGMVNYLKSLKPKVIRPYDKIYPIVQQSHLNSCWINSILVALMYCYKLNKLLEILIIEQIQIEKKQNSLARIIPEKLLELLILQYKDNDNMKPKECILPESFFVRDFITLLTNTKPDVFSSFSQVIKETEDTDLNDIILYNGGTNSDIFNFIRILLESGLGFTYRLDSVSDLQFYYKIINKNKNKITICVTKKKLSENYRDKIKSFDVHGFKFASMILWNFDDPNDIDDLEVFMDKEEEEEKLEHVITVVTDNNDKEYFYNGWMTENCANPLKEVLNDHIEIVTGNGGEEGEGNELITYKFNLLLSLGTMIFYKKETI